jgi:signal transduction histidine kinase
MAIENLHKSDEISMLARDSVGKAYYLDELGDVYIRKGEYDKAETSLITGLPIARHFNDDIDLESRILSKLGILYSLKREFTKALLYYDSAATINKKTDNDFGLAEINLGRGEVFMAEGKYKEAQVLVQESLQTAKILKARLMESNCFSQLSIIAEKEKDYKKALDYYKSFKTLQDSIFSQEMLEKLFQDQFLYKTANKDSQIADLNKAKTSSDSEVKKQEFIRNILVVVLALTAILLFTLYRSGQRRIKINHLLLEHQEEIKRRSEELEQLNEVKDKFFSIISHDLRSPINALSGILNLLEKQSLSPGEFASLTKELRVQFNSTKTLINNLLDWALLQMDKLKTQPEHIELHTLVDENFRMLGSYHLKDVNFINEVPGNTIAYADLNMVNLVFRNLILNAIKFTESGGRITVNSKYDSSYYTISVSDNGVGISPEVQRLLFEKTSGYSTRGTANEKGTGLGLILCKEFVEKNGGRIWMDSVPGQGSTFYFTLKKG